MWENVPSFFVWALERATSAINRVFLLESPFNHTQLSHVLFQLHMLELKEGKVITFVNIIIYDHMQGMCSKRALVAHILLLLESPFY